MNTLLTRRSALVLATSSALVASFGLAACGGGGSSSGAPANTDPNGWNQVTTVQTTDTVIGTRGPAMDEGRIAAIGYTLWLYDVRSADKKGTKITSNVGTTPATFFVLETAPIKGLDQGVMGMRGGGKRTIIIPASQAYGATGNSSLGIPANAALVYDVELDPNGWTSLNDVRTQDTVVGTGPVVNMGDTVVLSYTGWIYDSNAVDAKGVKFDSNVGGTPLTTKLGASTTILNIGGMSLIGVDMGIYGMRIGGKRTIVVPFRLAYSGNGQGIIPGGAPLVFDIELIALK